MAHYGCPYSSGYGSFDNMLVFFEANLAGGGTRIDVQFQPRTGWGGAFFGIYRNSQLAALVFANEGEMTPIFPIATERGVTKQSVFVMRLGGFNDSTYANPRPSRQLESLESSRVTVLWNWTPEILGPLDEGGFTTAWSLTGISRSKIAVDADHVTRGYYNIVLEVSGGTATVTLNGGGVALASGSGAVGTTVSLTAQNNSGLAGSTAVDALATSMNGKLWIRWPASMKIKRGSPSYPVVKTVLFNSSDFGRWVEESDLAGASYLYKITPVSDTGTDGTDTSPDTAVVNGAPEPPTGLAYFSGNAAATVLHFTDSTTVGATYNLYVSDVGAVINYNAPNPAGTSYAAGAVTLPAFTGYPGKCYAILRAVNGGIEEKNGKMVLLEYDAAGDFVAARPNTPVFDIASEAITSGLALSIAGLYNTTDQKATPTTLQLFKRTPAGSYNYASPAATATFAASTLNPIFKKATVSYTFASTGFYYITLKAATAGGVQSENPADEILVYVSNGTMAAATNFDTEVARG